MSEPVTVEQAIEVLNRIHEADPTVLPTMIAHRVPCNLTLAHDPTVQVGVTNIGFEVGLLGVLNGLFGIRPDSSGYVAAMFNAEHQLLRFMLTPDKKPPADLADDDGCPND